MEELYTLKNFHDKYPSMHNNLQALRFEVAKRDENGLMQSGAIIEKPCASQDRKSLLINESAYFKWLKG
tara:strand:- start:414 stop:620 length:207 start_codon:yes stop_codon:yes gene_type:complete